MLQLARVIRANGVAELIHKHEQLGLVLIRSLGVGVFHHPKVAGLSRTLLGAITLDTGPLGGYLIRADQLLLYGFCLLHCLDFGNRLRYSVAMTGTRECLTSNGQNDRGSERKNDLFHGITPYG